MVSHMGTEEAIFSALDRPAGTARASYPTGLGVDHCSSSQGQLYSMGKECRASCEIQSTIDIGVFSDPIRMVDNWVLLYPPASHSFVV